MRLLLLMIDGKDVGYSLVPEDNLDRKMLKRVQNLHFLASNKQQKMQYDGVMHDEQGNLSSLCLLQYQYARLPQSDSIKQKLARLIKSKVKEVLTIIS